MVKTLTIDDVIHIHERLTLDAESSHDPISPPGVKNKDLLESAIARQMAGYGGYLKYEDPITNAATLCYGICSNHPLHNGNKRTALVALMCHLDKNGLTFSDKATQDNLYSFMLKVASHKLLVKNKSKKLHDISDAEVQEMSNWIRKKTRKTQKGERSITYQEFEKILRQHNLYFENQKNNYIDIVKTETKIVKRGFFRKEEAQIQKVRIATIPYWPGRTVGKVLIKSVRKQANLTHQYGIDSRLFYGEEHMPDDFIQKYKKVINKLAKT